MAQEQTGTSAREGRPPIDPSGGGSAVVSTRLAIPRRDQLAERAEAAGMTMSEAARQAIEHELGKDGTR